MYGTAAQRRSFPLEILRMTEYYFFYTGLSYNIGKIEVLNNNEVLK
jgi:hypothetical protein